MKAQLVVIFTPLVNISSTEGCERQAIQDLGPPLRQILTEEENYLGA